MTATAPPTSAHDEDTSQSLDSPTVAPVATGVWAAQPPFRGPIARWGLCLLSLGMLFGVVILAQRLLGDRAAYAESGESPAAPVQSESSAVPVDPFATQVAPQSPALLNSPSPRAVQQAAPASKLFRQSTKGVAPAQQAHPLAQDWVQRTTSGSAGAVTPRSFQRQTPVAQTAPATPVETAAPLFSSQLAAPPVDPFAEASLSEPFTTDHAAIDAVQPVATQTGRAVPYAQQEPTWGSTIEPPRTQPTRSGIITTAGEEQSDLGSLLVEPVEINPSPAGTEQGLPHVEQQPEPATWSFDSTPVSTAPAPVSNGGGEGFQFPEPALVEPTYSPSSEPSLFHQSQGSPLPAESDPLIATPVSSADPLTTNTTSRPADRIHEVQPGENYWSISRANYGTIRYFSALAEYNRNRIPKPERMQPGMKVLIPAADFLDSQYPKLTGGKAAPKLPPHVPEQGYFVDPNGQPMYRIGKGDTLSDIAQIHLGRSSRWIQIFGMNRELLKDGNSLKLGMVLKLPLDATQVALAPAPATTR